VVAHLRNPFDDSVLLDGVRMRWRTIHCWRLGRERPTRRGFPVDFTSQCGGNKSRWNAFLPGDTRPRFVALMDLGIVGWGRGSRYENVRFAKQSSLTS